MKAISGVMAAVVVIGAAACAAKQRPESKETAMANWHVKMQVLSESLSRLIPLTSSPRAFNSPDNKELILSELKSLKSVAHAVSATDVKPNRDPGFEFMASRFASNMDEAVRNLEEGNRTYARRLIQQSTAHCIACHTRTPDGRSDLQLSSLANLKHLSKLERVNFFIAVRDYDKALNTFDEMVNSTDAQLENPHDMEISAEKALAIAVRVKRDPHLADELVSRIIDAKWAPVYLRLNASAWKKSIKEWRQEPELGKLSAKAQLDLAKRIMGQGWKANAASPSGQAGLVHFLRASTILHELLGKAESQPQYPEYLYYAGLAAENMRDMNLWTLQDAYYEACVRKAPKTKTAKKCYLRYEAIQMSSYATDEGAFLPRDVRDRLIELRTLSQGDNDQLYDWDFPKE
jgi:hypothetical protein